MKVFLFKCRRFFLIGFFSGIIVLAGDYQIDDFAPHFFFLQQNQGIQHRLKFAGHHFIVEFLSEGFKVDFDRVQYFAKISHRFRIDIAVGNHHRTKAVFAS